MKKQLVTVFGVLGIQCLSGAGYQNLGSDRILLMNNDSRPAADGGIVGQGYWDTNTTVGTTYWTHVPNNDNALVRTRILQQGSEHVLHAPDGTELWHLVDCRAGCTALGVTTVNGLPYSRSHAQTSLAPSANFYDENNKKINTISNAPNASVIMRDSQQAALYSPFYGEGIGTIYFDTVNSSITEGAKIQIQIATNLTEEALLYNEHNPASAVTFEEVHHIIPFEQRDAYYDWQTIPITYLEISGGTASAPIVGDTNLVLNVSDGGTNRFFRVRTQLNYYGPIRFRVKRLTESTSEQGSDTGSLVLIDNVVASCPPMTVKLNRQGEQYDQRLRGAQVLGCIGDFDKPLLSAADKMANAYATCSWVTNSLGAEMPLRLTNALFHYRWRYLDQKINPWQAVAMTTAHDAPTAGSVDFRQYPLSTNLVTVTGIPLPDGEGDLEYYFTAMVDAPYYEPQDYVHDSATMFGEGTDASSAWTERIAVITNRMDLAEDYVTPALGRDYFTRIRQGKSDCKWVELCTSVTMSGTDQRKNLRMELVGDHVWRYHYYVPTNMVGETFAFHFQGEEIVANADAPGYMCRTNVWHCDLTKLPCLPYASVMKLDGQGEASTKLDGMSTHLLIEFNDESLQFKIEHAAYQNFNTWVDAAGGYRCGANWNGEAATGVADTKQKYTLEMSSSKGWENSSFDSDHWYEPFDTSDFITYPFDKVWDEHATPNGWTAGHGHFIRSQRGQDEMALQLEGRGQGWIGMDNFQSDQMPHGIDQVQFRARLAQEPRFEDFAWYMDGISATNYAICALVSMGHKGSDNLRNPADISPGTPSVSLVGYYRPMVGCYEFRITRCGQEQLCAAIYKWTPGTLGMTSTMLASNVIAVTDREELMQAGTGQPRIKNFGNYLVPNTSVFDGVGYGSRAYLLINKKGTTVNLVGALSNQRTISSLATESPRMRTLVVTTDTTKPLAKGSFGVGSVDCAATFNAMSLHDVVANTTTNIIYAGKSIDSTFINGDWAFSPSRWRWHNVAVSGSRANIYAVVPTNQTVKLEFKLPGDSDGWQPSGYEHVIYGFSTNLYMLTPRVASNYQVRLRAGGDSGDDLRTDVVVDEIRVRAWQASNYPWLAYNNAEYTEWVYMQGLVEKSGADTVLRLQPSRAIPSVAQGLRSPYLGNGISMFSFDYKNGNEHTKLLLQVCTNLVSRGRVNEALTCYPPVNYNYNWTTVTNWDFSKMSAAERLSGTLTHYMSYRASPPDSWSLHKGPQPVRGLVRLVVDSDVIQHCLEEEKSPTRNLDYGQITITGAYCYDEPMLDPRSWYAWNFHTAGWNTEDRRFAYLFDSPDGLSGSLNFSALDIDNQSADAQGIGLVDRGDLPEYQANNSFVQSPTLTNGIGRVSFRARTFETNATRKASWVTLYGSHDPDDDQVVSPESWSRIADFQITNTTYQMYQWKTTDDSARFHAIRLEVAGSRHGRSVSTGAATEAWERPKESPLQRVFLDEISVSEAVRPSVAFRDVRPFRSGVEDRPAGVITNIANASEQPLLGERWGLQCTIEPQLAGDDIDRDSIKVYAAFHRGTAPWGYENWSSEAAAVRLDRIGGTLTYRSTISTPASIVQPADTPSSNYPDNVWQYYVWCEFQDKTGNPHRHGLSSADWKMPSWYIGITDLNEQYRSQGFAGYTILDTISPKRAWINEVNLCDWAMFDNSDGKRQFIEIAVPRGVDLSAWSLRLLSRNLNRGTIATFGMGDAQIRPNPKTGKVQGVDFTNDYTVVALRSPEAKDAGLLTNADGAWNRFDSNTSSALGLTDLGSMRYCEPYGIELVRPSGVVECQVVVQGTNVWAGTNQEKAASGVNLQAQALKLDGPQSQWVYVGTDTTPHTLGVHKGHGEDATCWTNRLIPTPSALNQFENGQRQLIDSDWWLSPLGDNAWIYASVFGDHLHQTIGERTNAIEVLVVPKGSSTNIVYRTDAWCRIGEVTTNDVAIADARGRASRNDVPSHQWTLKLSPVTDTLRVNVHEAPDAAVEKAGIAMDDPYYPAIMRWLGNFGDDVEGLSFAEMWNLGNVKVGELGLKDMYWLNINPTEPGWIFKAGMGGGGEMAGVPVQPVYVSDYSRIYTNVRVKVTMMITNRITKVARAPDRLQGLEPDSSSVDYGYGSPNWTGVTFKVCGALRRPDDAEAANVFRPLRWFVFTPESFDDNFQCTIDLWDPRSANSRGRSYGWNDYPGVPVWFRWRLDDESIGNGTVAEPLKAQSTY